MKKSRLLTLTIFTLISMFIMTGKVNAASYEFKLVPYNVTNACDLEVEGGQACYLKYLNGELESNRITNGVVEGGQNIMLVQMIVPSTDSGATSIQYAVKHDTTKVDYYVSTYGEEYGTLVAQNEDGNEVNYGYEYGANGASTTDTYFPIITSGRNKIKSWQKGGDPNFSDVNNGIVKGFLFKDSKTLYPLYNATPLSATFYTVKDSVSAGIDITFEYVSILGNQRLTSVSEGGTNAADKAILSPLKLSVLSEVSSDGTLKELKATGNNGTDYMLNKFVPSSSSNLEYNLIVPYSVNSITFTGSATDANVKTITGLETNSLNVGDNSFNITVVPENNGVATIYKVNVKRLSNDATLSSITTTNGVSFGTLQTGKTTYDVTVPYKTTSTVASATTTDSNATIDSGEGTWTIPTDNTTNKKTTFPIVVKAENCKYTTTEVPGNTCDTQTYNFNITRTAPSKNVNLSDLTVDGVTVPGFSPTTHEYTLTDVRYAKSSLTIGATVADPLNDNITGTGTKTIAVGPNTYEVIVTGEDGTTTGKYTIKVKRLSNNNLLTALNITSNPAGTMTPSNFNPTFGDEYKYSYGPTVTSINIEAIVSDTDKAKVKIINTTDGAYEELVAKKLNTATVSVGTNIKTLEVIVIPEDENEGSKTYNVTLERTKSTTNDLSSLSITPGTIIDLDTPFNPNKTDYQAVVDADVTSVTVNAVLADATNSRLGVISGNTDFHFGAGNIITIPVTSESGSTKTYTINVTRKEYNIATLDEIRVGFGGATPTRITGFNKDTLEYNLYTTSNPLDYETDKISIAYTKTNSEADVTGDIGTNLAVKTGPNQYKITVRSQDSSVTNVYKINVYRQPNVDNTSHSVKVAGVVATPEDVAEGVNPTNYYVTLPNSKTSVTASEVEIEVGADATLVKTTTNLDLSTQSDNIFYYTITSEDGVTENYQIHITREKSSNVSIRIVNLRLDGEMAASRSCSFVAPSKECTISVPVTTTAYFLEPVMDSTQKVTPVATTKYTMNPNLVTDGTQERPLTIIAEDDSTENYTVKVVRAKSSNANLKSITLTNITGGKNENISIAFNKGTPAYNIEVDGTVTDIKIEAEKEDSKATIVETLPHTMTINNYEVVNSFTINVTAEDGVADKAYTINVTRKAKTDATLKSLNVDGTLVSSFASNKETYSLNDVAYNKTTLEVSGSVTDSLSANLAENAIIKEVKVNGTNLTITSNTSTTVDVPLTTGANTIEVVVAAQNRSVTKTYTMTVNRAKNQDVGVKRVDVYYEGAFHEAIWNQDKFAYEITVPYNTVIAQGANASADGYVRVTPNDGETSTDALASVTMGSTNLVTDGPNDNVNTHNFSVQAEDETVPVEMYQILITRIKNNLSELSRVNLYKGSDSEVAAYCVVDSGSTNCMIGVDANTTDFRLEGIIPTTSRGAHVSFTDGTTTGGDYTLSSTEDTKVITATVTAENGVDKTNYTITVIRAASSNFYIDYIKTNANQSDAATLVPITGFDKTNPGPYEITVPGTTNSIKIEAKTEDDNARLSTDGVAPSNQISFTKNLGYGDNLIVIKAQAQDPRMSVDYKINVVREKNVEPRLDMIYIDGRSINDYLPAGTTFDKDTAIYELEELPYNREKINITVTNTDGTYGTSRGTGTCELNTKYYGKTIPVAESDEYVNMIPVTGIAHDTSVTKDYTIRVKRTPNNSTLISKVLVNYEGVDHEAVCDISNKRCTITVPNSVTVLSNSNVTVVTPDGRLTTDAKATASVITTNLSTTDESGNIVLNEVPIRVTAEDGTVTGSTLNPDYKLIVTREKSSDARLKTLGVYDETGSTIIGTLTPGFDAITNSDQTFTVTVPQSVNKIKVIGTAYDSKTTITGDGVIDLTSSNQTIVVRTTSEKGDKTIEYTLNIEREKNTSYNLGSLSVIGSDGVDYSSSITPPISASGRVYTVNVPNTLTDATVLVTPQSTLATASITTTISSDDVDNPDGDSTTADAKFKLTTNTTKVVKFEIQSESGSKQEYTLNINVAPKSDNTLSSLKYTLTGGSEVELLTDEAKDAGTTSFDIGEVPYNVSQISISAISNDGAAITGDIGDNQSITVSESGNTYRIIVTSEDGLAKTYTIKVKRNKNDDATLKELSVNGYALNETFVPSNKNNINYSVTVGEEVTSLSASDFVAKATDERNATVRLVGGNNGDGTLELPTSGSYDYEIEVKAHDGHTKLTYTVTVIRPQSTNSYLKSVNLVGATLEPNKITHTSNKYTLKVSNGTNTLKIKGIPEINTSDVTYGGDNTYDADTDLYIYDNISEGDQIVLTVKSETGNTTNYIFTVSYIKSNDATLSNLEVPGYVFEEGRYDGADTYHLSAVPKTQTALKVKAEPTDAYAKNIRYYNGNTEITDCENERECVVSINSGLNGGYIRVNVLAQDEVTNKDYYIYYTKVGDSDATLKTMIPSIGDLDNEFNSGTDTYLLTIGENDDSVDFNLVATQSTTTIKVGSNSSRGTLDVTVNNLTPGTTTPVVINMTAEDGTTKTYTVNIFRPNSSGNNDSSLGDLSVLDSDNNDYPLDKTFAPNEKNYNIGTIDYSVKELIIDAIPNVATSTVTYKVNGVTQSSNTVRLPDTAGEGNITIQVTAQDGSTTNYQISYEKAPASENNYLESLVVDRASLDKIFDKNTGKYNVNIPETQSSIDLTLTKEDEKATIKVDGADYENGTKITKNIAIGTSTINIVVISESGLTRTYQITVTRSTTSSEVITSQIYGHDISDGYIKTVRNEITGLDVKNQLDNDNSKLEIWAADDSTQISDSDIVGTGMIVKLIINGSVVDSKVIVVLGDVSGDGYVDGIDVSRMINYFLRADISDIYKLSGAYLLAGDPTLDGFYCEGDDVSRVINQFLRGNAIPYK